MADSRGGMGNEEKRSRREIKAANATKEEQTGSEAP